MPSSLAVLRDFMLQRYDDLKARLTRRLGCADMASDALQDTWLRLEGKDELGPVDSPRVPAADGGQCGGGPAARRNRRLTSSEAEALLALPDPAPGPAQTAQGREELDTLVRVMGELSERQRGVLLAVRLEGLPQAEVATRMGVSLRTVERELRSAHEHCATRVRNLLSP